jgi:hypothetical protein
MGLTRCDERAYACNREEDDGEGELETSAILDQARL